MRIADIKNTDNIEKIAGAGLLSSGFMNKGLLANETFRKLAHDGLLHLGIALGASSVWKGPKAIAESTMHGALAGAVFGGIGRFVKT